MVVSLNSRFDSHKEKGGCPVVAHTAGLLALAFSSRGHILASGDVDNAAILWAAQTGRAEHRIWGLFSRILSGRGAAVGIGGFAYSGTSLIRNSTLLGPYSRDMPRALWWP